MIENETLWCAIQLNQLKPCHQPWCNHRSRICIQLVGRRVECRNGTGNGSTSGQVCFKVGKTVIFSFDIIVRSYHLINSLLILFEISRLFLRFLNKVSFPQIWRQSFYILSILNQISFLQTDWQ